MKFCDLYMINYFFYDFNYYLSFHKNIQVLIKNQRKNCEFSTNYIINKLIEDIT